MNGSKGIEARSEPTGQAVSPGRQGPVPGSFRDLPSMKMIALFGLLRRGGAHAHRRQFDLSELEWRVMSYIGTQPHSLSGLAELMVLDRGQLSRAVKAMVARGLLTRERKPGGPEIVIGLSPQGATLHTRMVAWTVERDRALTGGLSPEDIDTVGRVLDHMLERARELLDAENTLEGRGP